jgi:DOPA 4,5-dioxygenase
MFNFMDENNYHIHVYYEGAAKAVAQTVILQLSAEFSLIPGAFHDNPVGPHPVGSCQVTVGMAQFGQVMDWLARNRQGLTIFIHANTGDVMRDHIEHTIWMGKMMDLNLDILREFVEANTTK